MAEKLLPYSITRVDWWQSENEYLSNGIDFSYSENIDIYSIPRWFQLSKSFNALTWFTLTWYVTKTLHLPNYLWTKIYFTSTGEIAFDNGTAVTVAHTLSATDKYIMNAVCYTWFVLFFTRTQIHKIAFTGNDYLTRDSITEAVLSYTGDYVWFSSKADNDLPIYNHKDKILYFGAGNKLFSIAPTLVAVLESEVFRDGIKIIWFSFLNNSLKIYMNYCNVNSFLHFRTETQSDSIEYKNRVFKAVTTDWQVDYVVCNDWLWMYNGVNGIKLFNYDFSTFGQSGSRYVSPSNLIGIDPYFVYVAFNKLILKRGKKFTNLEYWPSIAHTETYDITALLSDMDVDGKIYYGNSHKEVKYLWSSYKSSWFLEWIIFYWDSMEKIKKLDRLFDAFDVSTGTSIEIYFSVEWAAYPGTPNITISNTTAKYREAFSNELPNLTYHRIKVKIKLIWNWTLTPKQYEFSMLSEYVFNK